MQNFFIKHFLKFNFREGQVLLFLQVNSLEGLFYGRFGNSFPGNQKWILIHDQIYYKGIQQRYNSKLQNLFTQKMAFIQKVAKELTQEIVKNRKYNYSYQQLDNFLYNNPSINCNQFSLKNKRGQNISAMLLKKCISDTCIVYAHGLGSNKLQVIPVANHFKDLPYNVCAFDFSGSGRSQGNNTTYGLQQQDDVNAVLGWLDATRQYQKYILWGRSMGGASIILSQAKITNQKIQCIVLDSSFSSFEKVALQIASKASFVPGFVLSLLMEPLRKQFSQSMSNLNPFKIDVCSAASQIQTKMILIYSKNDKIVSYEHSKQISKGCKKSPIEIQIEEDHNKPRKKETYSKVNSYIQDSMKEYSRRVRRSRSKSRGISVTSKDSSKDNKFRKSICNSVFTDKSCNTEIFSMGNGSIQFTPGNPKKSSIIKSVVLKNQNNKSYSLFEIPDKENQRATINYQRKFKNSILGCFK